MKSLTDAIETLIQSIWNDEDRNGGLLSRDTLQQANEMRTRLAAERRLRGEPEPAAPAMPRQPKGAL